MKKFLSLALSLAMVFSMFTFLSIGANAVNAEKTYTEDYRDIQYKEAVDVISALEIMGGYGGGRFGPTGGLTRGAATKIICYMMVGPQTADKLPAPTATQFSDVPTTHTFAATIAYCAENNFISGYSDGSFHPGDPLSGNAFLKMLLCALGYDQDVEKYRNTSAWATNVVARAVEAGLLDDMPDDFDGRTALTREQAALLAFNTLQADMVEYENRSTGFITDGNTITPVTTGGTAKVRTWNTSNTNAANIDRTTDSQGFNIVQFAELKFNRLLKETQTDDFGKPSTKWIWKGDEVCEYPNELTLTYWGDKELGDIYKDLALTTDKTALFYVNGVDLGNITIVKNSSRKLSKVMGNKTYDADATADEIVGDPTKIGNSTKIEIFYDRDGKRVFNDSTMSTTSIVICATVNYIGKISKVDSKSDPRKVTVEFAYDPYRTPTNDSQGTEEFEEPTRFATDDIVTYTYSGKTGKIVTVDKLTNKLEGTLSRYSRGNSLTIRGTQYDYSGMVSFDTGLLRQSVGGVEEEVETTSAYKATLETDTLNNIDDGKSASLLKEKLNTNDSYVVYLNDRNRVAWVEEADQAENTDGSAGYALVRWMDSSKMDTRANNEARLILTDGSQRTVELYKDYLEEWFNWDPADDNDQADYNLYSKGTMAAKPVVHYTRESDGSYKLTRYDAGHNTANYDSSDTFYIDSRNINDWDTDNPRHTLKVDSTTIFIVNDDGTYRRYVGYKNVPNISGDNAAYAYLNNDGLAKYVWITTAGQVTTYSKDITFIAPASRSDEFVDGEGWDETYYTYNAVVAGEIRTIEVTKYADNTRTQLVLNDDDTYIVRNGGGLTLPIGDPDDDTNTSKAQWGVILNNTTKNSSGRYTAGFFNSNSIFVNRAHGIKTPANGEVEVGTATGATKMTVDLLSTTSLINAYAIDDDGNITRLSSVYDIDGDSEAWVFYTTNDDGEITNIFVCEDNN